VGVLNGKAIKARLEEADPAKKLVITPLFSQEEQLREGASSIDLRLGCRFASTRRANVTHIGNEQLQPAQLEEFYVPLGSELLVHPGQFVLATTLEWIRLPRDLAATVVGRSRLGRRGLIVATATGVHPTYSGVLTLEMTNLAEVPLELAPGQAVCQLVLEKVIGDDPTAATAPSAFLGSLRPALGEGASDRIAGFLSRVAQPGAGKAPGGGGATG